VGCSAYLPSAPLERKRKREQDKGCVYVWRFHERGEDVEREGRKGEGRGEKMEKRTHQ
jgi:hypothetical protein